MHTKPIQTTVTSNTHTHTHTHTHTQTHTHTHTHVLSFTDYIPPKYTYQKAENQTFGVSFALSLSLSLYSLAHRCRSHAVLQGEKAGEQLNTQRSSKSKSLVCRLSGIVWFLVEF